MIYTLKFKRESKESGYSIKDSYIIEIRNLMKELNIKEKYNFEKISKE